MDELCECFFISGIVVMLGIELECFLVDIWELVIVLGFGVNIIIGDDLVFKNNVLKVYSE